MFSPTWGEVWRRQEDSSRAQCWKRRRSAVRHHIINIKHIINICTPDNNLWSTTLAPVVILVSQGPQQQGEVRTRHHMAASSQVTLPSLFSSSQAILTSLFLSARYFIWTNTPLVAWLHPHIVVCLFVVSVLATLVALFFVSQKLGLKASSNTFLLIPSFSPNARIHPPLCLHHLLNLIEMRYQLRGIRGALLFKTRPFLLLMLVCL